MIELRTPREIDEMRPAGRFVAEVLTTVKAAAKPGVNLLELDEIAHKMIRDRGAESCYIDYHPSFGAMPFGKVICTSVNDAVLHGLPFDYVLRDGDLLSIDFAVAVNGWVSDSALSFVVGNPVPGRGELADLGRQPRSGGLDSSTYESSAKLIRTTEVALQAGIAAATVGNKVGDISAAIAKVGRNAGYSINTDFGGHGVGRTMHGDPHVPNDGRAGRGFPLKPGLVIAIEPWFLETTDEIWTDPDGWTLRSQDGSRGAHSEHTIAITEAGPVVLTARD
ncbi:type I methionyl aminopeptidase [Myceligenerans halotolerans]